MSDYSSYLYENLYHRIHGKIPEGLGFLDWIVYFVYIYPQSFRQMPEMDWIRLYLSFIGGHENG